MQGQDQKNSEHQERFRRRLARLAESGALVRVAASEAAWAKAREIAAEMAS